MPEKPTTHQGWDIAGDPVVHQGPQEKCWDPACERTENYFALDDVIEMQARLNDVLEQGAEEA